MAIIRVALSFVDNEEDTYMSITGSLIKKDLSNITSFKDAKIGVLIECPFIAKVYGAEVTDAFSKTTYEKGELLKIDIEAGNNSFLFELSFDSNILEAVVDSRYRSIFLRFKKTTPKFEVTIHVPKYQKGNLILDVPSAPKMAIDFNRLPPEAIRLLKGHLGPRAFALLASANETEEKNAFLSSPDSPELLCVFYVESSAIAKVTGTLVSTTNPNVIFIAICVPGFGEMKAIDDREALLKFVEDLKKCFYSVDKKGIESLREIQKILIRRKVRECLVSRLKKCKKTCEDGDFSDSGSCSSSSSSSEVEEDKNTNKCVPCFYPCNSVEYIGATYVEGYNNILKISQLINILILSDESFRFNSSLFLSICKKNYDVFCNLPSVYKQSLALRSFTEFYGKSCIKKRMNTLEGKVLAHSDFDLYMGFDNCAYLSSLLGDEEQQIKEKDAESVASSDSVDENKKKKLTKKKEKKKGSNRTKIIVITTLCVVGGLALGAGGVYAVSTML